MLQRSVVLLLLPACSLIAACTALSSRAPAPAPAPRGPLPSAVLLLRGGYVMTAAGPTLSPGDVLIEGSEIKEVGTDLPSIPGADTIDVTGRWLTPGLIDPHLKPLDGFWPRVPQLRAALAGGVTAVHVLPDGSGPVAGQGVTLQLGSGRTPRELAFPGALTTIKLRCADRSVAAQAALLRQALENARHYRPSPDSAVDHARDSLARALRGEILIQQICSDANQMTLRLELLAEFGIAPRAFHRAAEAYKIRAELADAGVGAVVAADRHAIEIDRLDAVPAAAALLDAAGVRVALHPDSPRELARLNQQAARAMAAGRREGIAIDRDRAIRWITANPAWILGLDKRIGTLERGMRADLVIWSGDPFSVYSRADLVFVAGRLVYSRSASIGLARSNLEPLSGVAQ